MYKSYCNSEVVTLQKTETLTELGSLDLHGSYNNAIAMVLITHQIMVIIAGHSS